MIEYLLPFLAVILGYVFVRSFGPQKDTRIKLLLAFSGALLLAITILKMLPNVYINGNDTTLLGLCIIGGLSLQVFLELFSRGAEHGHVHLPYAKGTFPWLLFLSLSVHAFLEGFPLNEHYQLLWGVVVHKLAVSIVLCTFLIASQIPKGEVLLFLLAFSLMTPLGTFASGSAIWMADLLPYINALVVGIFLHISTIILFESSEGHTFHLKKTLAVLLAIVIAYFL